LSFVGRKTRSLPAIPLGLPHPAAQPSRLHPSFSPTDRIAPHCDECSEVCSCTTRTARSRSSGEYFDGRPMGHIPLGIGPPTNPVRFNRSTTGSARDQPDASPI
jgi:hypothetical protein